MAQESLGTIRLDPASLGAVAAARRPNLSSCMSSDGSVSTSGSSSTALCLGFLLFLAGTTQAGEPAPHWAFQPLREQPPPAVQNERWIQSPVDRFILARLEALRVAPSPAAGRQQLIRRATFDLTGLAPTAAEAEAFLADTSPRAFQTVVDRLLNSPRYGKIGRAHV